MSKSTNVSVSMSPSCARAWRRLERSFEGDGAMLPVRCAAWRIRLHWRELRAIRGAEPSACAHHRARQADVRRQSGEHRRPAIVAGRSCRGGTSATSRCWSALCPVMTP